MSTEGIQIGGERENFGFEDIGDEQFGGVVLGLKTGSVSSVHASNGADESLGCLHFRKLGVDNQGGYGGIPKFDQIVDAAVGKNHHGRSDAENIFSKIEGLGLFDLADDGGHVKVHSHEGGVALVGSFRWRPFVDQLSATTNRRAELFKVVLHEMNPRHQHKQEDKVKTQKIPHFGKVFEIVIGWAMITIKMSCGSKAPLVQDVDSMLRTVDEARETLLSLRRTLNNQQDPHYHERDMDSLMDLGMDMECKAVDLYKRLKRDGAPRKIRRKRRF